MGMALCPGTKGSCPFLRNERLFQCGDLVFFAFDFGQELCYALDETLFTSNQEFQALNAFLGFQQLLAESFITDFKTFFELFRCRYLLL